MATIPDTQKLPAFMQRKQSQTIIREKQATPFGSASKNQFNKNSSISEIQSNLNSPELKRRGIFYIPEPSKYGTKIPQHVEPRVPEVLDVINSHTKLVAVRNRLNLQHDHQNTPWKSENAPKNISSQRHAKINKIVVKNEIRIKRIMA